MVGTYRMSFKATTNDCGGTNSDNGATGGVCKAVRKLSTQDFHRLFLIVLKHKVLQAKL